MSLFQALILLLCVVGFHGVFFHSSLGRKVFSWVLLQAGLVTFLFSLAPGGPALPKVLAVLAAAVTLSVGLGLTLLCRKFWKQYKSLDENDILKRVPK